MDHRPRASHYNAYQDFYDNDDLNVFSDYPLSDTQDYMDSTVMSSSLDVEQLYQHTNTRDGLYYAYGDNDFHSQAYNSPFQEHSSYDSRMPLESIGAFHQAKELPPQSDWGPQSRRASASIHVHGYEESDSYGRQQYTSGGRPGTQLRPVSELPDVYRNIFKFGVFNAVQSHCFDQVYNSDENIVISAPTGSGKTVLFELAILRVLHQARETGKMFKCVYVAPTKALCSERFRDWEAKFGILGIKCCELTGDTFLSGKSAWGDARNAGIMSAPMNLNSNT
ncbi:hypothetical protein AX15_006317 [Amanita polypyramis BW_CC]|nr:hypothetical protein AX15_006317 [Amanita polypyramis BW_CC]